MNIYSGVEVAVVGDSATITDPMPVRQAQGLDMTTRRAYLGRGTETVDQMYDLALGGSNILQNAHEFRAGNVAHFAPPQALHSLHGKVFKEQLIVLAGQIVRQFEEPITPLVDNALIDA